MKNPGQGWTCTEHPKYLTGTEAGDVSRRTDIPPDDAGLFIDLSRLDWFDRWRVMWARVGMHTWFVLSGGERDLTSFLA